ncbi:MAG: phosphoribosyltransferase domain-containing protein [Desulfamplus sp.]|nr:phosphoribosyltransferase domain-containing protein [Desulfamplus sp.]
MQDFYHIKRDNNPLREEAFTLSCLGKLFPASSRELTRCGRWLSELLGSISSDIDGGITNPDDPCKVGVEKTGGQCHVLIVGLTESGIIPAFLMYMEASRRWGDGKGPNPHLVYSTRRAVPGIPFSETHSHGPDHTLPLEGGHCDEIWVKGGNFDEVWIVEDEITSGNTVLNLMLGLQNHMTIKRIRVFAFADFRDDVQKCEFIRTASGKNIHCSVHIPVIRSGPWDLSSPGENSPYHGENLSFSGENSPYHGKNLSSLSSIFDLSFKDNIKDNTVDPCIPMEQLSFKDNIKGNTVDHCIPMEQLSFKDNIKDNIVVPSVSMEQLGHISGSWHMQQRRPALGVKTGPFFDPSRWRVPGEFSRGTLLAVGESVDMAAAIVLANPGLSFQQISLSPWKVDGKNICSRMEIGDKYYFYNYESLNEPVFILYDPVDYEIGMEVMEKLVSRGIDVKPFLPVMDLSPRDCGVRPVNGLPWNQLFYLNLEKEVEPFRDTHLFRPLGRAYNGDNTFWSTPSPEPDLDDGFWHLVKADIARNDAVRRAGAGLARAILQEYPDPGKIVFVSILRAGVPITDWLCRLLPGSVGTALSLFVGLGMDMAALRRLRLDYPHRTVIFVDGWTGRGGVARAIAKLGAGPLAVLADPWGWADFSGIQADIFCPSACFTGLATLGFSRTFFVDHDSFFSAYKFSRDYSRRDLVSAWQAACPDAPLSNMDKVKVMNKFYADTHLRIHSNEVCRALINAAPEKLFFSCDKFAARERFALLLKLAGIRGIPMEFNANFLNDLKTEAACTLKQCS